MLQFLQSLKKQRLRVQKRRKVKKIQTCSNSYKKTRKSRVFFIHNHLFDFIYTKSSSD